MQPIKKNHRPLNEEKKSKSYLRFQKIFKFLSRILFKPKVRIGWPDIG